MKVELHVYKKSKYNSTEVPKRVPMETEITGYEVLEISDEQMAREGWDDFDENHEYLILHFSSYHSTDYNTNIATFRNSHVDMFRI